MMKPSFLFFAFFILLALMLLGPRAHAQTPGQTFVCIMSNGKCSIVTSANPFPISGLGTSTATPLAPMQPNVNVATATALTVPSGAKSVAAICTAIVNWRDDGTAPTASIGMPLPAYTLFVYGGTLSAIQFIAQTSATCNFSYYK